MLLSQNITLRRSKKIIFEDVNISLTSKKIIILKGKNGSGKTTLLKTLLNIIEPTSGIIYWKGKILNKNLYDFYRNITYISDRTSSLRQLSVYENIKVWKKIYLSSFKFEQIESILLMLNLDTYLNKKVSSLSLGEIKKLELIRLILENKKIWLLDEPFTNLDKDTIKIMGQTFVDHCRNGGSILFSSHQNPEIEVSEEVNL
tara:strand:+ start:147 stop:752 length:606 start_codon:yes stop_codon:yes gene_type:complete